MSRPFPMKDGAYRDVGDHQGTARDGVSTGGASAPPVQSVMREPRPGRHRSTAQVSTLLFVVRLEVAIMAEQLDDEASAIEWGSP